MVAMEKPNTQIIDIRHFDPAQHAGKEVVYVGVPTNAPINEKKGAFSITGNPKWDIGLGLATLGWEAATLRMSFAGMLMQDDELAKSFRGGEFLDLHQQYSQQYVRFATRESKLGRIFTDEIDALKMQYMLGGKLAERGVGQLEVLQNMRVGRWLTYLGAAGVVAYGLHNWRAQAKDQQATPELRSR